MNAFFRAVLWGPQYATALRAEGRPPRPPVGYRKFWTRKGAQKHADKSNVRDTDLDMPWRWVVVDAKTGAAVSQKPGEQQ